jgi:hypothetical protein
MVAGPDNQQTGDEGEDALKYALAKAGFTSGRFDPDLGEDLWAEADGRRASAEGSFPYRALFQAKGSRNVPGDTFPYDIQTKHVRRWAAQPLPVFVVGVDLAGESRFFAKSIDQILVDDLGGKDPTQLTGTTVRVHLPRVPDLGAHLLPAIEEHYRSSQLMLAGLDQHIIEQDHFEILSRKGPEAFDRVPIAGWRVMWKSPRRPQYLAAMLTELARLAAREYANSRPRPAFVIFHIYRSQFDLQRNLATVRVDWVDPSHPRAADIIRIFGAEGGFRFRIDKDNDELREVLRARTATAHDFTRFACRVGTLLDEITTALLARPVLDGWDDQLLRRFNEVDELWNKGPDAPVECAQLDEMLKGHYDAMFQNYFVAKYRRQAFPPKMLEQVLRESLDRMSRCRGAWQEFARSQR